MNLNPFDLRGPDFLLFYAILVAATTFLIWLRLRLNEAGTTRNVESIANEIANDPYQIAFLRGGREEVIRVALVSLIQRGLLKASGRNLVTVGFDASDKTRRPLDKAILTKFLEKHDARTIFADGVISGEASVVGEALKIKKLLPASEIKVTRGVLLFTGIAFLWVIAGTKISIALSRGHTNVGFLVGLAVIAAFILSRVADRSRTILGNQVLSYLNQLFSKLSSRSDSLAANASSVEMTYIAALFGMAALPSSVMETMTPLEIQQDRRSGDGGSGGSWFSSSCSGGSSCGGGGGGGGCGGGGGGCGGCGG